MFFVSIPGFNSVLTTNTDKPHSNKSKWLLPKHFLRYTDPFKPSKDTENPWQKAWHTPQGRAFQTWRNTTVYFHSTTYLHQFAVFNNHPDLRNMVYRLWIFSYPLSPSSTSSSLPWVTLDFLLTSPEHIIWGFMSGVSSWKSTFSFLPGQVPFH